MPRNLPAPPTGPCHGLHYRERMRDPIADLVHRYADAVVRRDEQQWSATWTDDAVWQLDPRFEVTGREAIVSLWRSSMEGFRAAVQVVMNGTYELDDDGHGGGQGGGGSGTGRWYIQEFLQPREGAPMFMLGHYDDTYSLVDGQWRFASRRLVMHYAGPPDLSAPMPGPRG